MSDGIVGMVNVKPLVWIDLIGRVKCESFTHMGRYAIAQDGEWIALWVGAARIAGALPSIEAAKAAAQADYEARIMAALDVQPITVHDAAKVPEIAALIDALRSTLNFVENTENEMGIILGSGDRARAAFRAIADAD